MIPILYDYDEKAFITNGLGALSDATSCVVTEERNGVFELSMGYPVKGIHYDDILIDRIIYAKPSDDQDPQPFDIYKISKPINGHVTITAQHVCYRAKYVLIKPFTVNAEESTDVVNDVLDRFKTEKVEEIDNPFDLQLVGDEWSSKEESYSFTELRSFRECIGGSDSSFLETFGGEIKYDKFRIMICNKRGNENASVRIAYSKNLTDLTHTEDATDHATAIFPYCSGDDGVIIKSGSIVPVGDNTARAYEKVVAVDFRSEFDDIPTSEELEEAARKYIEKNKIGKPSVNLKVSFIPLWQTEEYKNVAPLERVSLCDYVIVEFKELGVDAVAEVIKTEYDVLLERYSSITLGEEDKSLDKTLSNMNSDTRIEAKREIQKSQGLLKTELERQKKLMDGGFGGYIVTNYDSDGHPSELIIGDEPKIDDMRHCIRINKAGIAFSQNGYDGDYISAWTINGQFSANWITAGEMSGDHITANTIRSGALAIGSFKEPGYTRVTRSKSPPKWVPNVYYEKLSGLYLHKVTLEAAHSTGITEGKITVRYFASSSSPFTLETLPKGLSAIQEAIGGYYPDEPIIWDDSYAHAGYPHSLKIYDENNVLKAKTLSFVADGYDEPALSSFGYETWNSQLYDDRIDDPAYWMLLSDDVQTISQGGDYAITEIRPVDWSNNYTNYYTRNDENVFGEYISIGMDKNTGKPMIKLKAGTSTIELVETNDRLSFYDVSNPSYPIEMAYISGDTFEAPRFRMGGFNVEQAEGVIFKWAGV